MSLRLLSFITCCYILANKRSLYACLERNETAAGVLYEYLYSTALNQQILNTLWQHKVIYCVCWVVLYRVRWCNSKQIVIAREWQWRDSARCILSSRTEWHQRRRRRSSSSWLAGTAETPTSVHARRSRFHQNQRQSLRTTSQLFTEL